jgi:hypothetical protein
MIAKGREKRAGFYHACRRVAPLGRLGRHALAVLTLMGVPAGVVSAGLSTGACASLTEPPSPEPVTTQSPAAPAASTAAAPAPTPTPTPAPPAAPDAPLGITTVSPGKGPGAQNGDMLRVHYTGTLTNGTKFDSSRDRDKPFDFTLGKGMVIKGWDQGMLGMKVGEKRKLVIPPGMAYGVQGRPGIPPNSTLNFDVELLAINPK